MILGVLLATVLLVPAASTSASSPVLSQLRVCGHSQVPFAGPGCARDHSSAALNANEFDCSVRITSSRATSFRAQFLYQGAVQYSYTARVRRGAHTRFIGVYFHDTTMPAGHYACGFKLGRHHLGKSFTGDGPTGSLLGPSACLAAHRVGIDECPRDESGAPLPPTNAITCDAVFARERGQTATIELIDAGGNVIGSQDDTLGYPITEAGATFTSNTGNFAPGRYDCSFSVAGQHADRSFSVSS